MPNRSSLPVLAAPPIAPSRPFHEAMYAFYSSEYHAIITRPAYMTLPVDDHLVHRGDGVFETLKCVDGRVYCLNEHLARLEKSAANIALRIPCSVEELRHCILETIRAGQHHDGLVRVLLSRGPGSMGVSPSDCPRAGLYILVHRAVPPFMEAHPEGARLATSRLPVKAGLLATIKTCNYLPNALLKQAAHDNNADFAVNFDEEGYVAEGATENIGIVTEAQEILLPSPGRILQGTTMQRAYELAAIGLAEGWLKNRAFARLTETDLRAAPEVLIFGTTTNVTAATMLDGLPVGTGRPGPVQVRLNALLYREQTSDNPWTTRAFM